MVAFVQLNDDDGAQVAQSPTPAPSAAAPPVATPAPTAPPTTPAPGASPEPGATATPSPGAGTTPAPSPTTGAFAAWPAGTTAYTVILWSATTRQEAETKATALQSAGQSNLGILHSNDYSSLRSGYWVVFSGQYDDQQAAQDAAQAAQSAAPGAYAKQVKPK